MLEILLVVAAIAILATIVIVAINPVRQLSQFRDSQRESHLYQTQSALVQYLIDNGTYPSGLTDTLIEICATGEETTEHEIDCEGLLDLSSLVPIYIASIPKDPLSAQLSGQGSGYFVLTGEAGRLCLEAPNAETKAVGDACSSSSASFEPLIVEVETTEPNQPVVIPVKNTVWEEEVLVDWGDGLPAVEYDWDDPVHTYSEAGLWQVSVTGPVEIFGNTVDEPITNWNNRVRSVISWGNLGTTSFRSLFRDATENVNVPNEIPSSVVDLRDMFRDAVAFNRDITGWNTGNVTNMRGMFDMRGHGGFLPSGFGQNISAWDFRALNSQDALDHFLDNNGGYFTPENYGLLLAKWASYISGFQVRNDLQPNVGTFYPEWAADDRQALIDYGWFIDDLGQEMGFPFM